MTKLQNPYLDEVLRIEPRITINRQARYDFSDKLYSFRKELVAKFSWAIPNDEAIHAIKTLVEQNKLAGLIEIGAGSGYWAWMLEQVSVNTIPIDSFDWEIHRNVKHWVPIIHGGPSEAALHSNRALFLCWPPIDEMGLRALECFAGEWVVLVGENEGGCTGTDEMWEKLSSDFDLVSEHNLHQFPGIYDHLMLYKRKPFVSASPPSV